ncbi:MAG: helix-turn-helix domain-containing protein [Xanthobacteraceae bacterium]|nr:helix-turn-helix domain-containing protein [Xanthobacteraceae bacterium]QYK45637.1 MAG: helix-turn-helix domain-containing protein [Xanthobacteraceae bacterium]
MPKSIFSPRHKRLAELVARQRRAAGLTQAEVARKLGRHQPFVANIESGERRLDVVEFLQLATVIDLDPHATLKIIAKIPEDKTVASRKKHKKGSR